MVTLSGPRQELFDLLIAKRKKRLEFALENPNMVSDLGEIFELADPETLKRDIANLGNGYVEELLKVHKAGAIARRVW